MAKKFPIKRWRVTAEINCDASRYMTVEVEAKKEKQARILAEEKMKKNGAFFVTNMRAEEVKEENKNG